MAASEVDLPEPVPPTRMTRPRLVITMSLRIGGSCISSMVGILALIVRTTQPIRPCCTNALTRKRPMPTGAIAKLHSLVESNSLVCLSFMIERTSTAACSGVSTRSDCGRISPSTLMAGGKPEVMNKSEPLRSTRRRKRSCINLIACSRSTILSEESPQASELLFVLRSEARFFLRHDSLLQQLLQALVERLHAVLLSGLDRGVHLRDLAFADQVTDRRGADHDLVRGDAAAADALEQRLRDRRAQRLRQHRAHHFLLGRREHVDDTVDGLGGGAGVQRAEHQVAGLRGGQRQADRLQVAHFADQRSEEH